VAREERGQGEGQQGGREADLEMQAAANQSLQQIFAMVEVRGLSTTAARKKIEKFDQKGDGKKGQPSRSQQSTTQVNSISQTEGVWGLRRMAMAVREIKAGGRGQVEKLRT